MLTMPRFALRAFEALVGEIKKHMRTLVCLLFHYLD